MLWVYSKLWSHQYTVLYKRLHSRTSWSSLINKMNCSKTYFTLFCSHIINDTFFFPWSFVGSLEFQHEIRYQFNPPKKKEKKKVLVLAF